MAKIEETLMTLARKAALNAYSPYSDFKVGAAVYCTDKTIVVGCNVENASYGLTVCAERNALFSAIAQGKTPTAIAVTCPSAMTLPDEYKMPCGACRQVMQELLNEDSLVIIDGVNSYSVSDLLPQAFRLK